MSSKQSAFSPPTASPPTARLQPTYSALSALSGPTLVGDAACLSYTDSKWLRLARRILH